MATVGTTTFGQPLLVPNADRVDFGPMLDGNHLWVLSRSNTGDIQLYRSINNGGSWTLMTTLVRADVQDAAMFIPPAAAVHVVYRTHDGGNTDRIWYRQYRIGSGTWSSEILLASASNGGVAGSVYTGLNITVVGVGNGAFYNAVAVGTISGAQIGVTLLGVYGSPNGVLSSRNDIFRGPRTYLHTGSGRLGPTLDIDHVGNGKGANVPNLWVTFGRTRIDVLKCGWFGGGWNTPASTYTMVSQVPTQNSIRGVFDGRRYLCASANQAQTDTVAVYERAKSHTGSTTIRQTPAHPAGVIRNCSITYDYASDNFRVYAVGTSNNDLYSVTYTRGTNTWGAWAAVTTTDVLNAPENWGVRRNAYGNARWDAVIAHAGAPNTVVHYQVTQAYSPGTPTWSAPQNGAAQNVSAALVLDWNFIDNDPADVQSAYALRRQVGAGAFQYWRASDSTWQATEQKNLSGTTAVTLGSGWAAASDANYSYAVKVWDNTDLPSANYSTAMVVVPSAKVNPTINTPTPAQVLASDTVTVSWTAAEQTAYRVILFKAGLEVYTTGFVAGTTNSVVLPYTLTDNSSWTVGVTTKNNEGLISDEIYQGFTTNFVEPPIPDLAFTALPSQGVMRITLTNPTPVGSEPALLSQDLYRREESPPLNANPYATTNTAGWTAQDGSPFGRSTAFAHEGVASFTLTGTGAIANLSALHDTFIPVEQNVLYECGLWARSTGAVSAVALTIEWYDAAFANVWTSFEEIAIPANRWTYFGCAILPTSTSAYAKPRIRAGGTVPNGQVVYFDEVKFQKADPGVPVIRVAAGVPANAVVDDWRAASGVSYEYRVIARGVNGTSYNGPWTV